MKTIKIVALLFLLVFLPACSTVQFAADDNYREELKRYVGKSIDLVVNSIGHADYTSSAPNGNKLYVYTRSGTSKTPVTCREDLSGKESCTGGDVSTYQCKTFFEVDFDSVVVATSFRGNGCGTCANKDALLCFRI